MQGRVCQEAGGAARRDCCQLVSIEITEGLRSVLPVSRIIALGIQHLEADAKRGEHQRRRSEGLVDIDPEFVVQCERAAARHSRWQNRKCVQTLLCRCGIRFLRPLLGLRNRHIGKRCESDVCAALLTHFGGRVRAAADSTRGLLLLGEGASCAKQRHRCC